MSRRMPVLLLLTVLILAAPARAFNFAAVEPVPAPEISFLDGDGDARTLEDFRGQVVVLNLWATWCAPCRREMPSLDWLQAEHGGEDLMVLPISQDRGEAKDQIEAFYGELGLENLAIFRDPEASAGRAFRAPGLPTTIVIDREGREVGRVLGHADWDSEEAVALVQAVMAE